MSYIGGIQYSVDNRTDNQLFSCIDRADMMEKIKADIMPMGYTGRIQANSSANYARNPYSELANAYGVNNRDISLLQGKGFLNDTIDASSRATQSASRFNYAFDRQINKCFVDVSGQFIPNNKLRVLPNRSCVMWGGGQVIPAPYTDPDLQQLSTTLMTEAINTSLAYDPADANKYLKFKATRPKLTRQDLMNTAQQYASARSQNLANPPAAPAAVDIPTNARNSGFTSRTQEIVDQSVINSARRRAGLSVAVP